MINRKNYELFIIDFYDEKLSATQKEELFLFLDVNPDLKDEFELYSPLTLDAGSEIFVGKDKLKRSSLNIRLNEQLIAYLENDLDKDDRKKIEEFANSDQEVFEELEILKKTKILPDYNIIFKNKKSLKRGGKIILFQSPAFSKVVVAASILLLFLSYYFFNKTHQHEIVSNQHSTIDSANSSQKDSTDEKEISSDKKIIQTLSPVQRLASNKEGNRNVNEKSVIGKKFIRNNFSQIDSRSTTEKNSKSERSSGTLKTDFNSYKFNNFVQQNDFEKIAFKNEKSNLKNDTDGAVNMIQKNVIPKNESFSIADIFTKQEINELSFDSSLKKEVNESVTFSKLVLKKVEAIAAIKEIKLNKYYNQNEASVTYNINFGQIISIEHINAK